MSDTSPDDFDAEAQEAFGDSLAAEIGCMAPACLVSLSVAAALFEAKHREATEEAKQLAAARAQLSRAAAERSGSRLDLVRLPPAKTDDVPKEDERV